MFFQHTSHKLLTYGKALVAILALLSILLYLPDGIPERQDVPIRYPQYQLPRGVLTIGTKEIQVFIAETPDAIIRGLSGLPLLDSNAGMFFVFDEQDYYAFWMPDMHFPIDIIWVGADWRIVDMKTFVAPETYPEHFRPKLPARYTLEINAGKADEWGLSIGDHVSLKRNSNIPLLQDIIK